MAGSGEVLALEADGADARLQIIVGSVRVLATGAQVLVFGDDSDKAIALEELRSQGENDAVVASRRIDGALVDEVDVHLVDDALGAESASALVLRVELNLVNLDLQLGRQVGWINKSLGHVSYLQHEMFVWLLKKDLNIIIDFFDRFD